MKFGVGSLIVKRCATRWQNMNNRRLRRERSTELTPKSQSNGV